MKGLLIILILLLLFSFCPSHSQSNWLGYRGLVIADGDGNPAPAPSLVPPNPKEALLWLKTAFSVNNPNISLILYNWVETDNRPCCQWTGVGCDDEGRVVALDLQGTGLSGPIPPVFSSSFPNLALLKLSHNSLRGGITGQDLIGCRFLETLDLSFNLLTGKIPPELGSLRKLHYLDLSSNNLTGEISSRLFDSAALAFFKASNNGLTGYLPSDVKKCLNLRVLDLDFNQLEGELPETALGHLPFLQELRLRRNQLAGNLTGYLFQTCRSLQELDMAGNQLSGSIPASVGNCRLLVSLDLSGNDFTGFLPPELGNLLRLENLLLGRNKLTGSVLSLPSNLSVLVLSSNAFGGVIPWEVLLRLERLEFLVLHSNNFYGGFPVELAGLPHLRHLDVSNNSLDGFLPPAIAMFRSLQFLYLASNRFRGSIPVEIGRLRLLRCLDLSSNELTGSIPVALCDLPHLLWLTVAGNRLSGAIPVEIASCPSLLWLNAKANQLTGEIPSRIGAMGSNASFTFQENSALAPLIPPSMGDCSALRRWLPSDYRPFNFYLDILDRGLCHGFWRSLLEGTFSVTLCPTKSSNVIPVYINLSGNRLTGPIPESLGAGSGNLTLLFLEDNQLTGAIPSSLGNLPLTYLNLSSNVLSGAIPASLGNLSCLTTLDLHSNNLSGIIPHTLLNLSQLTQFNISYNPDLWGPILRTGQFATFSRSSYLGNPLLCVSTVDGSRYNASYKQPCDANKSGGAKAPTSMEDMEGSTSNKYSKGLRPSAMAAIVVAGILVVTACAGVWVAVKLPPPSSSYSSSDISRSLAKSRVKTELQKEVSLYEANTVSFPVEQLKYGDIVWATQNFDEANVIGRGGFGIVYRATLGVGIVVAVKQLLGDGPQADREFLAEMQTLGSLRHTNLVPLLGCCAIGSERLLVLRYMVNGSLDSWLHGSPQDSQRRRELLDWPKRLNIARGAASALCFLHHECIPLIIHRDIKSSNILLDEELGGHLCDFGLARLQEEGNTHVSTILKGTVGYLPPEYGQCFRATTKGDVFSFGVLMLELVTGRRPMDRGFHRDTTNANTNANKNNFGNLLEWVNWMVRRHEGDVEEVLDPVVRESCPADIKVALKFVEVALDCAMVTPAKRPTMKQVARALEQMQLQMQT